eukprot:420965_1
MVHLKVTYYICIYYMTPIIIAAPQGEASVALPYCHQEFLHSLPYYTCIYKYTHAFIYNASVRNAPTPNPHAFIHNICTCIYYISSPSVHSSTPIIITPSQSDTNISNIINKQNNFINNEYESELGDDIDDT